MIDKIRIVIDKNKHPTQAQFILDKSTASAFKGGRGAGKSMGGAIKSILKLIEGILARQANPRLPVYQILVTAPSYHTIYDATLPAYEWVLRDYQLFMPEKGIGEINRSTSGEGPKIKLPLGIGNILFRTTDNPNLLRGGRYIAAHMDEPRDSPEEAFDVIIPTLLQEGIESQIWLTTTPTGFGHWTYSRFPDDGSIYPVYQCGMDDNEYLSEGKRTMLRKVYEGLSEEWIQQELGGQTVIIAGQCRFNTSILRRLLEEETIQPIVLEGGIVEIYKEPFIGRHYIAGGDTAEGLEGRDRSCLQILDAQTGEQVCVAHGQIPPDEFAYLCDKYCKKYNNAMLSIPSDPIDLATLVKLKELGYTRICSKWKTVSVKFMIESELSEAIAAGALPLHRRNTMQELLTYVKDEQGNCHAAKGCHDDEVSALMAAWQARKEPQVYTRAEAFKSYDYVKGWRK